MNKNKKQLIRIQQSLIFHFYRHHKDLLNEFRVWFVARHIVDVSGAGWASI